MFFKDLLKKNYNYVNKLKLQSDLTENRFSHYRQIKGSRDMVRLRDIHESHRILISGQNAS